MDTLTLLILIVGFLVFMSYIFPNTLENFIPDRIIQFKSGTYFLKDNELNGTIITITFDKPYSIQNEYMQPNNLPSVFVSSTLDGSYVASVIDVTATNFKIKIRKLPAIAINIVCKGGPKNSINWIAFIVNKGT